ncbi:Uncharacterised protein [Alistipes sp. cv1]|nr:Uncharacterised protein [Faecalibacterium prausnitzii]
MICKDFFFLGPRKEKQEKTGVRNLVYSDFRLLTGFSLATFQVR